MAKEFSKTILFTGAGFTHNFGGFLADGMWALIFNHLRVQKNFLIRELMLNDFNYESVYQRIIWEPTGKLYSFEMKEAIKEAVKNAYQHLDDVVRDYRDGQTLFNLQDFLHELTSDNRKLHFFFTINHDLFIERRLHVLKTRSIEYAGITVPLEVQKKLVEKSLPLEEEDFIILPKKEKLEEIRATIYKGNHYRYIKLHGSCNWKSSTGIDMLVIGLDKEDQINNEPLLLLYQEIFEEVLSQNDAKLLIIGYGFRDIHINRIIANAVKNNGLRIYIISPQKPVDFRRELLNRNRLYVTLDDHNNRDIIYSGLSGYFQYALSEIFPSDTRKETTASKTILRRSQSQS